MADIIFLDSNAFMYAAGAPHAYKASCVRILSAVEMGTLVAAINSEVLQELLYRYTHIKLADKGIQLYREILNYPLTILAVTERDLRLAIDLLDAHRDVNLGPRDAVHAATMLNNGISRLISADKDFEHLSFVTRMDPLAFPSSGQDER